MGQNDRHRAGCRGQASAGTQQEWTQIAISAPSPLSGKANGSRQTMVVGDVNALYPKKADLQGNTR